MKEKLRITNAIRKSYLFMLFCIVTSLIAIKSQTITWDGVATGLTPGTVTISGNAAKLRFVFVATGSAVTNATIEVTLPTGYTGTAISTGASMASGISYITSGIGTSTITVSITGGTLAAGKAVDLILDVKAGCSVEINGNASIKVKKGTTVLDTRSVAIVGAYPALRIQSANPHQTHATIGHVFNFDLELDASNNLVANSFKLTLTKGTHTTLTNFKLDGVAVTPTASNETTLVFTFNNINLGSTVKHLKFDASDIYAGTKNITTSLQYLSGSGGSNCGSAVAGPTFTFGAPAIPGTPTIAIVNSEPTKTGWVDENSLNGSIINSNTQVPMDGTTVAYFRVVYENTGSAPTKQLKQQLQVYRSHIYSYANIVQDASKIKYSVDGGVTIKTASASDVTFSDLNPANNGYRILKSSYVNKPRIAVLTINDPLPAGQKLMVYWPVVQGNIYDNSSLTPTTFASNFPWASLQWNSYSITGTDQNGAEVAVPQNTYGAGGISNPLFSSTPPSLSFRQAGGLSNLEVKILTEFGTVNPADNQTTDLYIQLPSWLELDGAPATAITTTGTIVSGYPKEEPSGSNQYVLRHASGGKRYVTVKYKVKSGACSGVNQTDEIYYWLNYNLGGNTSTRPVLKEIGQIRQQVTLLCETDGIVMDGFSPYRISRGLKDSGDDHVPDSNMPAPDTDIMHDTYLIDDKGKLIIEGTVKGGYGHLYLLLSSPNLNLAGQLISTATISVNGGAAQNVTLTKINEQQYYLHHTYSYTAGNTVRIEIPFTAKASNVNATVKAELYMTASAVSTPFSPGTARRGKDELFIPLNMYAPGFVADRGNAIFTNNFPVTNFSLAYMDSYHGNNFQAPFFEKEYRNVGKLKKYDITLPAGYIIPSGTPLKMIFNSGYIGTADTHAQTNPSQTTTAVTVTNNADGSTRYSYDLTTIFQEAYNTVAPLYSSLTATKWIYPDERYFYDFSTTIKATPAAVASGIITNTATYTSYADNHTTNQTHTRTFPVAYTGPKATLALSATSVTAYNKTITLPVLGVSNVSASANTMWLYIKEGDGSFTINSSNATPTDGGTPISSVGNGKWINLGSVAANTTKDYKLNFTVSTVPCIGNKKVEIYLFSTFGGTFSPNTSIAPPMPDHTNLGDTKTLSFSASTASIAGSMSVNDSSIRYQTPYTFTAELSAAGGEGDVYEAKMEITVPAGQKYVANSAQYVYGGTTASVPAAVQSAINTALGAGSALSTARTYTFKASDFITGDILSGAGGGAAANKQTIGLKMNFTSECETNLLESAYTATIYGKNVCGNPATGNNTRVAEMRMIYTSNILFTSTIKLQGGIQAFNEIYKKDTLQIDITKTFGTGNLTQNDSVEIIMHENIDVSAGSIVVSSAHFNPATLPFSRTTAAGKRSVKVALPWAQLNALGNGGTGRPFTYKIPLEYHPADTVSPENKIEVKAWNEVKLNPVCPPQMFPVGSDELKMALVVGNTNPDTVYVGDTLQLHIASPGFAGSWYSAPSGGTLHSTSNPWLFTPTMAHAGNNMFYFSAEFNGVNYGRLPYNVKVFFHPRFIRDLDTTAIICTDKKTLSIQATGMGLTYQWYYNLKTPIAGATDSFYVATLSGKYHVIATDSTGASISSDTLNLYINVVPEFTKDLPLKIKECYKRGYRLEVETTGNHLMYQWYRNGIEIPGAIERTYYAAADDSSAFFRVSVKTLCGDSIMSQQCYLSFCDEDPWVMINRPVTLIAPKTVTTNPPTGVNQVESHTDFEFTVKVKDGYSLKYINITTDDPIWTTQGGIKKEMISDVEMKVIIRTVIKPLTVTVDGISPVSNENMEDNQSKIWAHKNKVYIRTIQPEIIYIYTSMGQLYKQQSVEEGLTSFDVTPGVYFITFQSGYSGKVIIK